MRHWLEYLNGIEEKRLILTLCFKRKQLKFPLDKVWKYSTPEGVNTLVTAIIHILRESDVLEPGVLYRQKRIGMI